MFTKEQIINLGVEKLADFVLSLSEKENYVQKELELIFAVFNSDPSKIASLIKEKISSLDYKESPFILADQVNEIRTHIMENVYPKWPRQAADLLLCLLDSHKKTLEDDQFHNCRDAFQEVCMDFSTTYDSFPSLVKDVVKLVHDRYMNNNYNIYDYIIYNFQDVLGNKGFKQLTQKFKRSFNGKNTTTIKSALKAIADIQDNIEAYIQACSLAGEPGHDECTEIVTQFMRHDRVEEAISFLDSSTGCSQYEKLALKIGVLSYYGKHKEAQVERQKLFDHAECPEVYNFIIEHAEADSCEPWKKMALQKIIDTRNPIAALYFLEEVKEFQRAAELIYEKIDTLHTHRYLYMLRSLAQKLCDTDPLAATLLCRLIIEENLIHTESNYDDHTVKDLVACHNINSKIIDWKGYKSHELYFKEVSVKYKRKEGIWSQYILELNNQMSKRQKMTE